MYSSNSLRFTNFRVPTYKTKGQFGCFNMESILLIPMLLYSAASLIVNVIFKWIGTLTSVSLYKCSSFSSLLFDLFIRMSPYLFQFNKK